MECMTFLSDLACQPACLGNPARLYGLKFLPFLMPGKCGNLPQPQQGTACLSSGITVPRGAWYYSSQPKHLPIFLVNDLLVYYHTNCLPCDFLHDKLLCCSAKSTFCATMCNFIRVQDSTWYFCTAQGLFHSELSFSRI